ncbi:Predicted membrane protein [Chryseobacterium nakagawai]|uniref:Zinc-ribbon domain-containing protein n=1 Tax=Chryseobacterium nakagawai TaxID=1241982 RepID=A0AAD1DS79_CHRNA|nr:zinc-ribbon domain-containing protein [Chryseobacterium nakagawai]AZA92628.1 zinc-ribbon domain-containing protein [Chryseobacterium nakagawai]VEH19225.1 Predicted membrane protein [Chryseobacterium nakagawai]
MSLNKCPQCQNQINDTAFFCPQCGYSIKDHSKKTSSSPASNPPKKQNNGCAVALLFMGIAFIIFLVSKCSGTKDNSAITTNSVHKISKEDSIKNQARIDSINQLEKIEEEKFLKTKAGKIYKKHPEWSKEDCISISENKIWIGMRYEMLVYMRGKPNNVNTSNYGNGPHYQACWHDYDASCFYFDESQIITSYN